MSKGKKIRGGIMGIGMKHMNVFPTSVITEIAKDFYASPARNKFGSDENLMYYLDMELTNLKYIREYVQRNT